MKKLIPLLTGAIMLLSLAACGGADANVQLPSTPDASSTGSDAEYNISIASTGLPTQAPYMATTDFVSAVETAGNGRFKFVVHDSSSLGTDEDILKQVIDGTLQVSAVGGTTFSMYTPLLEVLSLPFLLTDYEKEYAALTSDEYRAICDAVGEQLGIKILFTTENGIRHFATTKKPVTSMADLAGLKIRIPTSDVLTETIKALGANPVTIQYSELYSALQNNVVDGEEVNYSTLAGQMHYEVVSYLTEVGMYCFPGIMIANLDFWNSLSAEDRQIFLDASDLAVKNTFEKHIVGVDEEARAKCEENGMQITVLDDAQLQEFKDATAYIVDEYAAKDPLIADFVEMARNLG